jgi:hypothetical protein
MCERRTQKGDMICVFLGCDDRPMVVGQTVESGKFREEGTVLALYSALHTFMDISMDEQSVRWKLES